MESTTIETYYYLKLHGTREDVKKNVKL